ncbi:MAG: hypothetical protein ACOCVC_06630 [Spirochaeta sp.]
MQKFWMFICLTAVIFTAASARAVSSTEGLVPLDLGILPEPVLHAGDEILLVDTEMTSLLWIGSVAGNPAVRVSRDAGHSFHAAAADISWSGETLYNLSHMSLHPRVNSEWLLIFSAETADDVSGIFAMCISLSPDIPEGFSCDPPQFLFPYSGQEPYIRPFGISGFIVLSVFPGGIHTAVLDEGSSMQAAAAEIIYPHEITSLQFYDEDEDHTIARGILVGDSVSDFYIDTRGDFHVIPIETGGVSYKAYISYGCGEETELPVLWIESGHSFRIYLRRSRGWIPVGGEVPLSDGYLLEGRGNLSGVQAAAAIPGSGSELQVIGITFSEETAVRHTFSTEPLHSADMLIPGILELRNSQGCYLIHTGSDPAEWQTVYSGGNGESFRFSRHEGLVWVLARGDGNLRTFTYHPGSSELVQTQSPVWATALDAGLHEVISNERLSFFRSQSGLYRAGRP